MVMVVEMKMEMKYTEESSTFPCPSLTIHDLAGSSTPQALKSTQRAASVHLSGTANCCVCWNPPSPAS